MATGVQSSQSSAVLRPGVTPASQPPAASAPAVDPAAAPPATAPEQPAVLRSGERQASTLAALENPNSKTYYHRIPGAKFIMPNGLELQFLGGQFVTDDPEIIAELDKVKDKATSMIFTKKESIRGVLAQENAAAEGAAHTDGIDGKQG